LFCSSKFLGATFLPPNQELRPDTLSTFRSVAFSARKSDAYAHFLMSMFIKHPKTERYRNLSHLNGRREGQTAFRLQSKSTPHHTMQRFPSLKHTSF
jgi:hypothetical protein